MKTGRTSTQTNSTPCPHTQSPKGGKSKNNICNKFRKKSAKKGKRNETNLNVENKARKENLDSALSPHFETKKSGIVEFLTGSYDKLG